MPKMLQAALGLEISMWRGNMDNFDHAMALDHAAT